MKKNVSGQKVGAQLVNASTGAAFTGSVTVSVTGDAGTQATGSVGSGACTHEGNGYHTYAPSQAETNYDLIAFTFTGTGAIPVTIQVYPSFPQTADVASGVAVNSIAANAITAAATAADFTTEIQSGLATAAGVTAATAPLATTAQVAALPGSSAIADAVWDEALSGHLTAGTTGAALNGATAPSAGTVAAAVWAAISGYGGQDYATVVTGLATESADTNGRAIAIETDTQDIQARIPAALVSGRMDSSVGAMASNVLTAAALATDAVTEIVDAIKAMTIEGSRTFAQTLRGLWSLGLTKASGFDTGTVVTRDAADTKNRMTIVTGSTGRTSVTVGDLD